MSTSNECGQALTGIGRKGDACARLAGHKGKHVSAQAVERDRERAREYRAANSERVREYMREYRAANSERLREYGREYHQINRDRALERQREYNRETQVPGWHGFSSRREYDAYLAQGCSVEGCGRPATQIDHDHSICPQALHSCDRCRRGALCHEHNTKIIAAIDALRTGKREAELQYLGLAVTFTQLATEEN